MKIAQRFNAGIYSGGAKSRRDGRIKLPNLVSIVPPGLVFVPAASPALKTLGYFRTSLRDKLQLDSGTLRL